MLTITPHPSPHTPRRSRFFNTASDITPTPSICPVQTAKISDRDCHDPPSPNGNRLTIKTRPDETFPYTVIAGKFCAFRHYFWQSGCHRPDQYAGMGEFPRLQTSRYIDINIMSPRHPDIFRRANKQAITRHSFNDREKKANVTRAFAFIRCIIERPVASSPASQYRNPPITPFRKEDPQFRIHCKKWLPFPRNVSLFSPPRRSGAVRRRRRYGYARGENR